MERLNIFLNDLLICEVILILWVYLYSFYGVCTIIDTRKRTQSSVHDAVMPILSSLLYITLSVRLALALFEYVEVLR